MRISDWSSDVCSSDLLIETCADQERFKDVGNSAAQSNASPGRSPFLRNAYWTSSGRPPSTRANSGCCSDWRISLITTCLRSSRRCSSSLRSCLEYSRWRSGRLRTFCLRSEEGREGKEGEGRGRCRG